MKISGILPVVIVKKKNIRNEERDRQPVCLAVFDCSGFYNAAFELVWLVAAMKWQVLGTYFLFDF